MLLTAYLVQHTQTLNLFNFYRHTQWAKEPSPHSINSNECLNDIYIAVKMKFLSIFYYVFNVSHATVVKLSTSVRREISVNESLILTIFLHHISFKEQKCLRCILTSLKYFFLTHLMSHLRWEFFSQKRSLPKNSFLLKILQTAIYFHSIKSISAIPQHVLNVFSCIREFYFQWLMCRQAVINYFNKSNEAKQRLTKRNILLGFKYRNLNIYF